MRERCNQVEALMLLLLRSSNVGPSGGGKLMERVAGLSAVLLGGCALYADEAPAVRCAPLLDARRRGPRWVDCGCTNGNAEHPRPDNPASAAQTQPSPLRGPQPKHRGQRVSGRASHEERLCFPIGRRPTIAGAKVRASLRAAN